MAEFDTILFCNPTEEDFKTGRYNGELYPIKAGEEKQMPHFLARHLAKHLSDKIVADEWFKEKGKKYIEKPPMNDPQKTQRLMMDNPQRRIALYRILRSKEEVERTIKAYPQFKADTTEGKVQYNFVGEMSVYDDFVEKEISKGTKVPKEKTTSSKTPVEETAEKS